MHFGVEVPVHSLMYVCKEHVHEEKLLVVESELSEGPRREYLRLLLMNPLISISCDNAQNNFRKQTFASRSMLEARSKSLSSSHVIIISLPPGLHGKGETNLVSSHEHHPEIIRQKERSFLFTLLRYMKRCFFKVRVNLSELRHPSFQRPLCLGYFCQVERMDSD
jgi:hypothetical protein